MVQNTHQNFNIFYTKWQKMRDVFSGDHQMKQNAKRYIAPLKGQEDEPYYEVINRETFENYTLATAKGITGLIFAKAPQIELQSKVNELSENIDLAGNNIVDLSQTVVNEIECVGRCGLLVDMITPQIEITSRLQEDLMNLRPYIKLYTTENIINWDTQLIDNRAELSFLVLCEPYTVRNGFVHLAKVRYRVYEIEDGICIARIFENMATDNQKDNFQQVGIDITPKMNGKTINYIPFVSITSDKLSIEPHNPPLLDLADINISHWYLNVERRNALHWIGFPSVYGSGIAEHRKGETIELGAGTINIFREANAKLNFLELSGTGLMNVEKALEEKKNAMLALGARLLAPESSSQISENTMQMKTAGNRATIILIADTVSRGIEKALSFMSAWLNEPTDNIFRLNTDYNLSEMNPQILAQIYAGKQMGILRDEDVFFNLKKGEIIDEDVTEEEYLAGKEAQSPLSLDIQNNSIIN